MHKNIYFDVYKRKMHLWETFSGKTVKSVEDYEYKYYVRDPEHKSPIKDIHGNSVIEKRSNSRKHLNTLKETGLTMYESDLDEMNAFLQERYGKLNEKPDQKDFNVAYMDIEIESGDTFPKPEEAAFPINLITVIDSKTGKTSTWGNREYTGDSDLVENYYYIPDEKRMLESFVTWWRKQKFDIVTGWNVKEFDIQYILNRLAYFEIEKSLSPINISHHKRVKNRHTGKMGYHCTIAGLTILDYMELYKKFTMNVTQTLESYSLNFVANFEELGGKLELEGHIKDAYKTNWNQFVEYNIVDTELVKKIDDKKRFINLSLNICSQSLVPLEKVFSSVVVIEGYMLRNLHKNNMVMSNRESGKVDRWKSEKLYKHNGELQNVLHEKGEKTFPDFYVKGGHVEANPGLYNDLLSFDVTSLYPTNIMQYNISNETKVFNPTPEEIEFHNLIKTPINGVYYKRKEGILPAIVKEIFNERKEYKKKQFQCEKAGDKLGKEYNYSQQMVRKILINSMYGVMINEFFHFYDVDNARVVTRAGRTLIRFLSSNVNEYFKSHWHKVAKKFFPHCGKIEPIQNNVVSLIDTDSNYICLHEIKEKCAPVIPFDEFVEIMETKVLTPFFDKLLEIWADKYGSEQIVNFKREGVILKQLILAKKKYITQLLKDEDSEYNPPKMKYTGIEIKRSDTPKYCRDSVASTLGVIFKGAQPDKDNVMKHLRKMRKEFINQPIENISFNKGINGYQKYKVDLSGNSIMYKPMTPMHVRASINYNWMVENYKLPYLQIDDAMKVKYIFVKPKNILGTNVIAYVGNYPEEFNKYFDIDYKEQMNKSFLEVIQRIFWVLKWGTIDFKNNKLGSMLV